MPRGDAECRVPFTATSRGDERPSGGEAAGLVGAKAPVALLPLVLLAVGDTSAFRGCGRGRLRRGSVGGADPWGRTTGGGARSLRSMLALVSSLA